MILIIGKNISLREIDSNDLEIIREWRNTDRIRKQFFIQKIISKEEQEKWYIDYLLNENDILLLIETKNGDTIGTCSLYNIDKKNKRAELGRTMLGNDDFIDLGYMKESILVLIDYGFNVINLNSIYLEVFNENKTAIELYKRCGFKKERILKQSRLIGNQKKDTLLMNISKKK